MAGDLADSGGETAEIVVVFNGNGAIALFKNGCNVLASMIFAGISGSAVADTAGVSGMFMPIIFPIAMSVGIDPIVLGVLVTVVIGIGLVTPPVGMCLYVAADLMKIKVSTTFKYLIPYIIGTFVCIAICILFPQLITYAGRFL